jgi:F-type H+-transporting ATPase subunit b
MTMVKFVRAILLLTCVITFGVAAGTAFGETARSSSAVQAAPAERTPGTTAPAEQRGENIAEPEEANEKLTHSASVQYLATKTGMTVHQVHLVMFAVNFLLIAFLIYWFSRKSVPAALRSRTEAIQRALEEGRAASENANRRLGDIEARLGKLDSEIAAMRAQSEKDAEAEMARIRQAAEEDMRKIAHAAEQEIAAAAKQARRELAVYTADLAVSLARKQIRIDAAADQALVRQFAGTLSSRSAGKDGK